MPEKQGVELNLFRNPGREVALDGDKDPKAPCRLWRKMLQPGKLLWEGKQSDSGGQALGRRRDGLARSRLHGMREFLHLDHDTRPLQP